jgi:hypothetical protein
MHIEPVAELLARAGITEPEFNVLRPTHENYRALLMQPQGDIDATTDGVANRNADLAHQQHLMFLARAHADGADLVVTPEYSMPWRSLIETLKAGRTPDAGKLWALGCESLKVKELGTLQDLFGPSVSLMYEAMPSTSSRFVDPLAYVFRAQTRGGDGDWRVVVLVQFKTYPMGDDDHFEVSGLEVGLRVYQFGTAGQSIRLVSLLCSDAFAFKDPEANQLYDRSLILHLQLNPSPRQAQYRAYRDRLLQYQGDETEIVCLNWARNVTEWSKGSEKCWKNIAASAWYLRPDKFDCRDATLDANHRRGLYYTWLGPQRCNALFLNYEPAVFELEATKVAHVGVPASVSRRRGPQLARTSVWNVAQSDWVDQSTIDDGFSVIVGEAGEAAPDVTKASSRSPVGAERLLALSAGQVKEGADWFDVRRLDSFNIDSSEVVFRMTYCQDIDERAGQFRVERLRRIARLKSILRDDTLPPALSDLKEAFAFDWDQAFPETNVVAHRGRATLVYAGEGANRTQAEAVFKRLAECLRRRAGDGEERSARQRLAVWFLEAGAVTRLDASKYIQIDEPDTDSEFDIGRSA